MVGACEDLALHDGVNVDCGVKTRRRARVTRALGSGSSETTSSLRHTQHISAEGHSASYVFQSQTRAVVVSLVGLRTPLNRSPSAAYILQVRENVGRDSFHLKRDI